MGALFLLRWVRWYIIVSNLIARTKETFYQSMGWMLGIVPITRSSAPRESRRAGIVSNRLPPKCQWSAAGNPQSGRPPCAGLTWPGGSWAVGDDLTGVAVNAAGAVFVTTAGGAIYRNLVP